VRAPSPIDERNVVFAPLSGAQLPLDAAKITAAMQVDHQIHAPWADDKNAVLRQTSGKRNSGFDVFDRFGSHDITFFQVRCFCGLMLETSAKMLPISERSALSFAYLYRSSRRDTAQLPQSIPSMQIWIRDDGGRCCIKARMLAPRARKVAIAATGVRSAKSPQSIPEFLSILNAMDSYCYLAVRPHLRAMPTLGFSKMDAVACPKE
jgi:hypothetical protein